MHKLEAEDVLEVEVMKVDNRMRKYYRLTEKGTKETASKLEELDEFLRTLQGIIQPNPKFN